eukprot:Nitzschia sp. Nitz4//scaffold157_size52427//28350//29903//NITZ4_006842-RA/size52427-augustus-gene-0.55-mRNA-1//1//CDS//3329537461//4148//frame0
MGGQPSSLIRQESERSVDDEVCQPCFFMKKAPFSRPTSDPMGTPIITPNHSKRKQFPAKESLSQQNRNQPIYSSKYMGLEKEVVSQNSQSGTGAQIHEGKDAESLLHAKYSLREELGVGSTSVCHRCVNKRTDLHYACKVIDKRLIEERFQGMMKQFHTEIEALRELEHPNIIQLYDVFITEEKIFIVMELMEGGELFDYVVQKGTLTEEEASAIVRKVTSALVYMHSKNIIHRDLKPENLLLRRRPRHSGDTIEVKIIDFGLSKAMEEPVARSFLGTRGYLAPEMLQRREYTKAVDTWALGVIVFVLLCGCLPFDDDSQTVPSDELVRAKFVLRFPRWAKNVSASAKDLLTHLLETNPSRRYSAQQALAHPWVTGKEAPKGSLLASPGRIKKSPNLRAKANRTPVAAKHNGKLYAPKQGAANAMSPNQRVLVRKTSI